MSKKLKMKKGYFVAFALITLMSCNSANDGDATTDTTNFNRGTGVAPGGFGDTTIDMDASTGVDTTSRPYSGSVSDTVPSGGANSAASGTNTTGGQTGSGARK